MTAPPPWSLRSQPQIRARPQRARAAPRARHRKPASQPLGARSQSLGSHRQRRGHHPHHQAEACPARPQVRAAGAAPALARPALSDTPLGADVKEMIVGQLNAVPGPVRRHQVRLPRRQRNQATIGTCPAPSQRPPGRRPPPEVGCWAAPSTGASSPARPTISRPRPGNTSGTDAASK